MIIARESVIADRYGTFEGEDRAEPQEVDALLQAPGTRTRQPIGRFRLLFAAALLLGVAVAGWSAYGNAPSMDEPSLTLSEETGLVPSASATQTVRVFVNEHGEVSASFGASTDRTTQPDAWGTFNDSLLDIGWSQLWIRTANLTKEEYEDMTLAKRRRREIMFAAGYAEGQLTHHRIDQHFLNVYRTFFPRGDEQDQAIEQGLHEFFTKNLAWMRHQVRHHDVYDDLPDAEYWNAMSYILAQFDGLVAGYQHASVAQTPASMLDLFLLNADGDMEDLVNIMKCKVEPQGLKLDDARTDFYTFIKNLKCSALVRILPDFSDLIWGHDTWDSFASMNRIFKHYDVPLPGGGDQSTAVKRRITMSSSPGFLSSVDDWYMTNAGLGVMETTNGVFDSSLYDLVAPESIPCWLRSKVANLLATDGRSWAETFSKYNSGTYNNQWMVVDTKKFVKGEGFLANGLTVLEQLPGYVHVEDVSDVVNTQGYWASYNVPYFKEVYERSGFAQMYAASNYSTSWSHDECARAQIFRRDAPAIASFDDFKRVMRSNNWHTDPLSEGHASHAVASRYDLETDPGMFSLDGAIDAKATTSELLQSLECDAVAGPTHDNNPVFEWTPENTALASHEGHPPRFDFDFTRMKHFD